MKAVSTRPFNAMGVVAPEAGMTIDVESAVTFAQLKFMGYIEPLEGEMEVINEMNKASEESTGETNEAKKAETKRAKRK